MPKETSKPLAHLVEERPTLMVVQGGNDRLRARVSSMPPRSAGSTSHTRLKVLQVLKSPEEIEEERALREEQGLSDKPTLAPESVSPPAMISQMDFDDQGTSLDLAIPPYQPFSQTLEEYGQNAGRYSLTEGSESAQVEVSVVLIDIQDRIRKVCDRRYTGQWWKSEELAVLIYGQLHAGVMFMDKELINEALFQLLKGNYSSDTDTDTSLLRRRLSDAYPHLDFEEMIKFKPNSTSPDSAKIDENGRFLPPAMDQNGQSILQETVIVSEEDLRRGVFDGRPLRALDKK